MCHSNKMSNNKTDCKCEWNLQELSWLWNNSDWLNICRTFPADMLSFVRKLHFSQSQTFCDVCAASFIEQLIGEITRIATCPKHIPYVESCYHTSLACVRKLLVFAVAHRWWSCPHCSYQTIDMCSLSHVSRADLFESDFRAHNLIVRDPFGLSCMTERLCMWNSIFLSRLTYDLKNQVSSVSVWRKWTRRGQQPSVRQSKCNCWRDMCYAFVARGSYYGTLASTVQLYCAYCELNARSHKYTILQINMIGNVWRCWTSGSAHLAHELCACRSSYFGMMQFCMLVGQGFVCC